MHSTHTHIRTHAHIHTQDRYSAIDIAACSGHKDVVELLLDVKADPELTNKEILTCVAASKVTTACYHGVGRLYMKDSKDVQYMIMQYL